MRRPEELELFLYLYIRNQKENLAFHVLRCSRRNMKYFFDGVKKNRRKDEVNTAARTPKRSETDQILRH